MAVHGFPEIGFVALDDSMLPAEKPEGIPICHPIPVYSEFTNHYAGSKN